MLADIKQENNSEESSSSSEDEQEKFSRASMKELADNGIEIKLQTQGTSYSINNAAEKHYENMPVQKLSWWQKLKGEKPQTREALKSLYTR